VVREQVVDRLKHAVETSVNTIMSKKQVIREIDIECRIMNILKNIIISHKPIPMFYTIIVLNKKKEQVAEITMYVDGVGIKTKCDDIVKLENIDEAITVVAGIQYHTVIELSRIDKYLLRRIMDTVNNALFKTEYEYIYPNRILGIDMIYDIVSNEAKKRGPIIKIYYDIEYLVEKHRDKMTVVLEHYTRKDGGRIVIDHHLRKVAETEYRIEDGEIDIWWVSTTTDEDLLKILLDVSKSAEATLYRIIDMFLSEKIVEHNGYIIQTYI